MKTSPRKMPIKHWDSKDRPREKFLAYGDSKLSNAKLLSILIGSGSVHDSAVRLMQLLLSKSQNKLRELQHFSLEQMTTLKGIGNVKAMKIKAALALGQRLVQEEVPEKVSLISSQSVYQLLNPLLAHLKHEEFWVHYLNQSNRLIEKKCLSKGGITQASVDVRLVLKRALEVGATAMILAHNHPSGDLKPSAADKSLTKKINQAAATLDLKILDHIILTEHSYFSFADEMLF